MRNCGADGLHGGGFLRVGPNQRVIAAANPVTTPEGEGATVRHRARSRAAVAIHVETRARTIAERATLRRRVADEAQTSVGRSRTLVATDYELVAGRTSVASGDTLIDGERVLLG
jgi:hypothetical protein